MPQSREATAVNPGGTHGSLVRGLPLRRFRTNTRPHHLLPTYPDSIYRPLSIYGIKTRIICTSAVAA